MKGYIILGVVLLIIFSLWFFRSKRENYGGPVKRIRRIPKGDCYALCGQYYEACMAPHYEGRLIDAGMCMRNRDNCISVCNYSDFQRM